MNFVIILIISVLIFGDKSSVNPMKFKKDDYGNVRQFLAELTLKYCAKQPFLRTMVRPYPIPCCMPCTVESMQKYYPEGTSITQDGTVTQSNEQHISKSPVDFQFDKKKQRSLPGRDNSSQMDTRNETSAEFIKNSNSFTDREMNRFLNDDRNSNEPFRKEWE